MQRDHTFSVIVISLLLLLFSSFYAQCWSESFLKLPISDIGNQLGRATVYIIDLLKQHSDQKRADSVGQLVKDLAELSNSEESLASRIDYLSKNPGSAYSSYSAMGGNGMMMSLNTALQNVHYKFSVVAGDVFNIDPQFAAKNGPLQIDVGSVAHDGALFYCINTCHSDMYVHEPAIVLTHPDQTAELSDVLKKDVAKIRELSSSIQKANDEVQKTP